MLGYFKHSQEWADLMPLDQLNLTRHPTIPVLVRFTFKGISAMNNLHPALKAIIKKKLPVKARRDEEWLLQEINSQKTIMEGTLKNVRVTLSYDNDDIHTQEFYHGVTLPLEHRQLIDMILRQWSTVEQVKALQRQLRAYNAITKKPRTD